MKRLRLFFLVGPLSVLAASCGPQSGHTVVTESEIFTMDRIYGSMSGPKDRDVVTLLSTDKPEVPWVTATRSEIVGADGESPELPEYFCHSTFVNSQSQLIDLTTGKSVFKAIANNYADQIAVEKITHYSSAKGILILRDHDYEIIAVYNNTTGHDIDSMAVMYLYLHDTEWVIERPKSDT